MCCRQCFCSNAKEIGLIKCSEDAYTQYDAFTLSPPIADENSSTEQVALTVPVTDDPSLPTVTFWAWTLGALACALLSFLNQSF
ncbi:hypothetical protein TB1_033182 [Malus domestica]